MSFSSLYSKIQLKIEEIKKRRERKFSFPTIQLFFWRKINAVVRILALIFEDSSNNFLIFTKLDKDSVFVCNNSYCQYKTFQKRVRFFSKMAFIGILVSTIITTGILYFMLPGKPISQSASYSWAQNSWLGGADEITTALHPGDKTGWTKFYSKDDSIEITGDGKVTLGSTSGSHEETSDGDFGAGTKDDNVYISEGSIYLKKPLGAICSIHEECNSSYCNDSVCVSWACGGNITFTYRSSEVTYGTVLRNSECWLDRNLGASQVAIAYNDSAAYGDSFQWGRLDDDHQDRDSAKISITSSTDIPGHGSFILVPSGLSDWRTPQNDNLWQGVNGVNNPCPSGWRLPTEAELDAERISWSSNDRSGAYTSPLKLVTAGLRGYSHGGFSDAGICGFYWSSTINGTRARCLIFTNSLAGVYNYFRANAPSIRCLKD